MIANGEEARRPSAPAAEARFLAAFDYGKLNVLVRGRLWVRTLITRTSPSACFALMRDVIFDVVILPTYFAYIATQ